jgi:membrane associated rhomboid family serine protease
MDDGPTPLPAPPTTERCYRHPDRETLVHCTRCGRPICPECMIPAPVGHHCPECVAEARREFRRGPGRRILVRGASITRTALIVLVIAFVVELLASGSPQLLFGPSPAQMIKVGATDPLAIALQGQYWRFVTSVFLHYGVLHLAVNGYALMILGTVVESEYGRGRWVLLFLATGIAGGVASYAFGPLNSVGAGASGAIFGLMGAFLADSYSRRNTRIGRMQINAIVQTLILNLVITLAVSFIDWRAHLGGFVAGVVLGALLRRRARPIPVALQVAGVAIFAVAVAGLALWRTEQIRDLVGGLGPFAR